MSMVWWVPLCASVLLRAAAQPLVRRLSPRTAALTMTAAAVVVGACTVTCLGLLAASALGQQEPAARLGRWSAAVVEHGAPVPSWVGLVAAAILVAIAPAVLVSLCRRLCDLGRTERAVRATSPLVVLDDPHPSALAIGGLLHGRIALSTGLLSLLDDTGRAAVLAHEQAHLRGRHHLLRTAVRLAVLSDPLLAGMPALVTRATERWADECAAAATGDRRAVARALSATALATRPVRGSATGIAAQAAVTGHFAGDSVAERVGALLAPAAPARCWPVAVVAVGLLAVVVATGVSGQHLDGVFDQALAAGLLRR